MNHPNDLSYSKSHEWIKMDGDTAIIGISDFAQDALGDVVFVNLPAEGDDVTAAEAFGDVESVKAVSDLICPVTGKVAAINEELLDSPELLNSDPYGAWIIKVEGITDKEELLDAAQTVFRPENLTIAVQYDPETVGDLRPLLQKLRETL